MKKKEKKIKEENLNHYLCEIDWDKLNEEQQLIAIRVLIMLMRFRIHENEIPKEYRKYFIRVCDILGNKVFFKKKK